MSSLPKYKLPVCFFKHYTPHHLSSQKIQIYAYSQQDSLNLWETAPRESAKINVKKKLLAKEIINKDNRSFRITIFNIIRDILELFYMWNKYLKWC